MPQTAQRAANKSQALTAYKAVLRDVLDSRPSGTRQRLAMALGKNRSFVSQIANAGSPVPAPAEHLPVIFEVCHFSLAQREAFLAAYRRAHPQRLVSVPAQPQMRDAVLHLPDLGDARKNRQLDQTLAELAKNLAAMLRDE